MNAKEILSIEKCGDLFPYGADEVRATYRELVRMWHPDDNASPAAAAVFEKINELYARALQLLADGEWEKTNYILIPKENGKKIALNYDTCFSFELGTCYVTKTKVVYVLSGDKEKYYNNTIFRLKNLHYKDRRMEAEIGRFFPKMVQTFRTKKGEFILVFDKPENVRPLKDVVKFFGGKLPDRHVAWILSRLCSLACYLQYGGLVHNGINLTNCFLSPENHAVYLYGGWWYTTREKEKMIGTTKEIFSLMPVSAKGSGESSALTDLESIKYLGRQLLGEENCRKLSLDTSLPKPFLAFVTGGSGKDACGEFEKWDRALMASYGERKFIKMEIEGD